MLIEETRDYQTARTMIERGQALPLDLVFRLVSDGVDVDALEAKYRK